MSVFSDIDFESLSSNIEGEEHLSKDCNVFKFPAVINDNLDKIIWVFVRHCVCGEKRDAKTDVNNVDIISVPKDGFDIHTSSNCDLYIKFRHNGHRKVYRIERQCYCKKENISYPG